MARTISSSLLCSTGRWFRADNTSSRCCGRRVYWGGMNQKRKDSRLRVRDGCHWWQPDAGGRSIQECRNFYSFGERIVCLGVYSAKQYDNSNIRCSMNGSSDTESLRYLTTNVTVNLTQQIIKTDVTELQIPYQTGPLSNVTEQKNEISQTVVPGPEGYGEENSAAIEDMVLATLDANVMDSAQGRVLSVACPNDERWWHIPDSIEEILRLPSDFEERIEALFRSFGSHIDSRELLLRVLVHKSYYDQNMPIVIREQQYLKPHSPLFVDSGEVRQQYVDGPSKISCMIFGDAHGEVQQLLHDYPYLRIFCDSLLGIAAENCDYR